MLIYISFTPFAFIMEFTPRFFEICIPFHFSSKDQQNGIFERNFLVVVRVCVCQLTFNHLIFTSLWRVSFLFRYTSSVAVLFFYFCCFHDGCKMLSTHKTHTKCTRTKHIHKKFMAYISHLPTTSASVVHQVILPYTSSWCKFESCLGLLVFSSFFIRFGVSWGNFKIKCTFHPFYYCSSTLPLSADDDRKATNTIMVDERGEEAGRRVIMNPLLTSTKLNVQFTCTLHTESDTDTNKLQVAYVPFWWEIKWHQTVAKDAIL